MEHIKKCKSCKVELGEFEGNQIPIQVSATSSFNMPSGGVDLYCDKCYADITGKSILEEGKKSEKEDKKQILKIAEYKAEHPEIVSIKDAEIGETVEVIGLASSLIEDHSIEKDEKPLKIRKFTLKDDTDSITLVLWNDDIDKVEKDKIYRIKGFVKEFKDLKQLSLGYSGTAKVVVF